MSVRERPDKMPCLSLSVLSLGESARSFPVSARARAFSPCLKRRERILMRSPLLPHPSVSSCFSLSSYLKDPFCRSLFSAAEIYFKTVSLLFLQESGVHGDQDGVRDASHHGVVSDGTAVVQIPSLVATQTHLLNARRASIASEILRRFQRSIA